MSDINIIGDSTYGKYNFIQYNYTNPIDINTFNSSLCSVLGTSDSQLSMRLYKPTQPFPPFTQFTPNSGYVVYAKQNFTLTGTPLPLSSTIAIKGASTGMFNLIRYNFLETADISAFNASLCAVQTASPTLLTKIQYKPGAAPSLLTQFVPGSGYLIRAKTNFYITGTLYSLNTIANDMLMSIDGQYILSPIDA